LFLPAVYFLIQKLYATRPTLVYRNPSQITDSSPKNHNRALFAILKSIVTVLCQSWLKSITSYLKLCDNNQLAAFLTAGRVKLPDIGRKRRLRY
jgi:hypothetical protein